MKHKAPLTFMEQAVMLTVFALAAVLCLRAFVWSDETSKEIAARDEALLRAQTAAEVLKHSGGDVARAQTAAAELLGGSVEQGSWYLFYDENWDALPDRSGAAYVLSAREVPTEVESLSRAEVRVEACGDREATLCALPIAWQGGV